MNTQFTSFVSMVTALPTDAACREYLEMKRWGGVPVCPHCATVDTNLEKNQQQGLALPI